MKGEKFVTLYVPVVLGPDKSETPSPTPPIDRTRKEGAVVVKGDDYVKAKT